LEKLFVGWEFLFLDAKGRSRGLITTNRSRAFMCINCWSFELGLGVDLYSQGLEKEVVVLNIYAPYANMVRYWEKGLSGTY
jgi:hypothetical protein